MTSIKQDYEHWLDHIDQAWSGYQSSVQRLRDCLGETGEAEWDQIDRFAGRVQDTRMSVANIEVRSDENWNEACIDRAHELCVDLNNLKEEVDLMLSKQISEDLPEN